MRLVDADVINYDNTTGCAECEVMECHACGDHKYIFKKDLDKLPTVDPYIHSYWDDVDKDVFERFYKCHHCHGAAYIKSNYCPNCGAKMDIDIEVLRQVVEQREHILIELANIWAENPQLRLGQLITNLGDVYYIEDEKLVEQMRAFYNGHK